MPQPRKSRGILRKAFRFAAYGIASVVGLVSAAVLALHLYSPSLGIHALTDGARTVTFAEMVHVGSPAYFARVRERIRLEGGKGATYLYEGVKGTPEESARLSSLIGFGEVAGSYGQWLDLFTRLADLEYQPQASFLGLTGRPDVNADLSAAELVAELSKDAGAEAGPKPPSPPGEASFKEMEAELRESGALEPGTFAHAAGRYLVQAVLKLRVLAGDALRLPPRLEAAFRKRDEALARAVAAAQGDVVITYGAGHYAAFRELLGPGWKLVSSDANKVFE